MAEVMRIANYAQTSTVDLLGGTLQLERQSWATRAAGPNIGYGSGSFGGPGAFTGYGNVAETFSLIGSGTVSALTAAIVELEEVARQVREWQSGKHYAETWWFEWNADGEDAKRGLIHAMALAYPTGPGYSPLIENGKIKVDVALTRHPLWEKYGVDGQGDTISNLAGAFTLGDVPGTEQGRIASLRLQATDAAIAEAWVGIRPTHAGYTSYNPLWECESGTDGTDATDEADDPDPDDPSSGDDYVQVSFTTDATLALRWSMAPNQAIGGSDYNHFIGRYLILARCRVSTGTVGLQLQWGWKSGLHVGEEIYIENTAYMLVPLGEIAMPPWTDRDFSGSGFIKNFTISIYAERVSGAGTLDLDCIVLMPAEHICYVSGASADGATWDRIYVKTLPDESVLAYQYSEITSDVGDNLAVVARDWYLPVDGGRIVYAANTSTTGQTIANNMIFLEWRTRWLSYRHDAAST